MFHRVESSNENIQENVVNDHLYEEYIHYMEKVAILAPSNLYMARLCQPRGSRLCTSAGTDG